VLAVGQVAGVALGPDVEAEDDGVGGRGQRDVVLGDRADAAVDDPQRDLGSTSILSSASSTASTEPLTSPLRMRLSWVFSPSLRRSNSDSRVGRPRLCARAALRSAAERRSAIWRATRSSSTTRKLSPAPGTPVKPRTCTGWPGLASATCSPRSLSMARTRPKASPATIESPTRSVPRWTRTVATGRGPCRGAPRWRRPGR
jgi:hypothetical protein